MFEVLNDTDVVKVEANGDVKLACGCEVGADGSIRYSLFTCKARPSHFNQMCAANPKPARRRRR